MSEVPQYVSTESTEEQAAFCDAVLHGIPDAGGLYMPDGIPKLSGDFLRRLPDLSLPEIGCVVMRRYIPAETVSDADLRKIIHDALDFDIPLVRVEKHIYSLELFHGPTLAFKDVGARFLGRILPFCAGEERTSVVLVATSGDTGSAVAHGLLNIPGVEVVVLYPDGKVSPLQERQFASIGGNVTALAVDGVFDDCQRLVKRAFADPAVTLSLQLTSANSINIARWLPQSIYYFLIWKELQKKTVISVPSGNFGNFTAGVLAQRMGLPVERWIAACNANDVVPAFLKTGEYTPRPSVETIANAMDVGDPGNFVRLQALYDNDVARIRQAIRGVSYTDDQIRETISTCFRNTGYLLDPHGATGYRALREDLGEDETGVFLATAHPAKFAEVYSDLGIKTPRHPVLERLRDKPVLSRKMSNDYWEFRRFLLGRYEG